VISGSGAATVAAVGSAMYPEMVKRGYDKKFVAATIACGGTVGVVIPPSIPLIVYGVLTNTSIAALFFGGIIPGIIACLNLMVCCHLISGRRGYQFESVHPSGHVWKSFKGGFLALLMPLIILEGIYGGIFTPTESAAGVSGLTIEEIVRNYIPCLLSDLFTLLLIVYIPQLTLLLPGLLIG
jgi:TRAP-type C4-dicarboxylate transport system, large permease component